MSTNSLISQPGLLRSRAAIFMLSLAAAGTASAAAAPRSRIAHPHPRIAAAQRSVRRELNRPAEPPPALVVRDSGDGYDVTGRDFGLHLDPTGAVTNITRGDRPLFSRAAVEIRGKTWHIKLAPTPQDVEASPPRAGPGAKLFSYAIHMDDTASGVRMGMRELVAVRPTGVLIVTLTLTPLAAFESQRIAWTLQFPADLYLGQSFILYSNTGERTAAIFPQDRAPDPHMARDFNRIVLEEPSGPVEVRFSTAGRRDEPLPIEDMLEDLRWWSADRFWIEFAAPYGPSERPVETPLSVAVGDVRTLKMTIDLHPNAAR